MKKTLLFITTIFLTACSQKAVYDNIQLNNRIQCDKVPLSENTMPVWSGPANPTKTMKGSAEKWTSHSAPIVRQYLSRIAQQ